MPDADATIITQFVIEASDALEDLSTFNDQIEETKTLLKETSEANRVSMRSIAKELKEAFKTEQISLDHIKCGWPEKVLILLILQFISLQRIYCYRKYINY